MITFSDLLLSRTVCEDQLSALSRELAAIEKQIKERCDHADLHSWYNRHHNAETYHCHTCQKTWLGDGGG